MRIVRYLLTFTALVLILGVGSFFVVREALLYWGTQSLVESLRSLKESATSGLFEIECARKTGGTGFELPVIRSRSSCVFYLLKNMCLRRFAPVSPKSDSD